MDRKHNAWAHAVAWVVAFLALARPDLLWSSVPPRFGEDGLQGYLESFAVPVTPGVEEAVGADRLLGRLYELRGYQRTAGQLARGENLGQVLRRAGVEPAASASFTQALRPVFDPRKAKPGDRYELLVCPEGRLEEFSYRRSPLEVYRACAEGDGWQVERVAVPVERREVALAGQVSGSLYESFLAAGADPDLVMAFVELFSWDVDFNRDTQPGDEFRAVYEQLYVEDEPAGNGRILAAQYQGTRGVTTALYYRSGRVEGYFDQKGESVRKSFLRSPLKLFRISSRFSRARLHPVLNIVRPHLGVDYAAPAGTPVHAVADARVLDVGWRGQGGKTVVLSHARGYETTYIHLSRYAAGLAKGDRVRQGQVIGYVGSTGLSTGPHLDFRVKKNGVWVDPLKEKYVAGDPIPEAERGAYREALQRWTSRLAALAPGLRVAQGPKP